jgi:ubiquinone/menaquinone biosynthesis C-methylase UbiE
VPKRSNPSDRLRGLYEARAAQQYSEPTPLPDPRVDRKFAHLCESVRANLPCGAFLDAGCGDGRFLAALDAELPERVAGVDIAATIVETARARMPRADLRQANIEALPFADGEFDLVLCSQVIEHVLDAPAAIRELRRVLRPGGRLVISTDNERNRVSQALNAPRTALVGALRLQGARGLIESPATPYTLDSFRALLEEAELEVVHVETFRFHLMWPLDRPILLRMLNAADARLPDRGAGDILLAVARKP